MNKKAPHTEYIEYKGLRIPFSRFLPLVIGFVLGVITTIGLLVWFYFNYYTKYYHSISKEDFDRIIQASIIQTQNALTPKTVENVQHPTETIVPSLQQLQITNTPRIETIENIPTLTPSLTPTFTRYLRPNCIPVESWYVFPVGLQVPVKPESSPECYDLQDRGIEAQTAEDNNLGMRIRIEAESRKVFGLYSFLQNEEEINLLVKLNEIIASDPCTENKICDTNLILGFGDPTTETRKGWFLIFRVTKQGGEKVVCLAQSVYSGCRTFIDRGSVVGKIYNVKLIANNLDNWIVINGARYLGPVLTKEDKQFWLGYYIRSQGKIDGFIQFLP